MSDASADDLSGLLAALEERLSSFGAPVVEAFRPGASARRIVDELAAAGLAAPDDLVAWWGWHDGVEGPDVPDGPGIVERAESVLVDGWHVLALADALRIRRWTLADYAEAGGADVVPLSWIPVLQFTGTAYLAADSGAGEDEVPLYVVDGGAGLPERPPTAQFGSLRELVSLLLRVFEEDVVRRDPDDGRIPVLEGAPETAEVRRLTRW